MMYLRYGTFRKQKGNRPEDLVSRALYRRGPIGFTGILYAAIFDDYCVNELARSPPLF